MYLIAVYSLNINIGSSMKRLHVEEVLFKINLFISYCFKTFKIKLPVMEMPGEAPGIF